MHKQQRAALAGGPKLGKKQSSDARPPSTAFRILQSYIFGQPDRGRSV